VGPEILMHAADRTWKLPTKSISLATLRDAAEHVATKYEGVTVDVEDEGEGCLTCFYSVPVPDDEVGPPRRVCEVSLYNLGNGAVLLSLEAGASDNGVLDEAADQLVEDLADKLGARSVDL